MSALLKERSLPILLAGMLLTAVLSLSVHAVMLQALHIPMPSVAINAPVLNFLYKNLLSVFALIYLAQLGNPMLERFSWLARSAILFAIWMGLNEDLFRGAFMDGYCTDAYTYAFAAQVPKLSAMLIVAALVAGISPRLVNFWKKTMAALLLSALWKFVLVPLSAYAFKAPLESLAFLAPQAEWCHLPYGANVLVPAYLSFVEPTLACFAAVALVWAQLSRDFMTKLLQFVVLILLLKKLLFAPFVYMMYAQLPPLTALGSMGQFSLEALVLALGAGLTWSIAARPPAIR